MADKTNAELIADELRRMYREHLEGDYQLSDDMLQLCEMLDDYKEIQEEVDEALESVARKDLSDLEHAYRVAKYGN